MVMGQLGNESHGLKNKTLSICVILFYWLQLHNQQKELFLAPVVFISVWQHKTTGCFDCQVTLLRARNY